MKLTRITAVVMVLVMIMSIPAGAYTFSQTRKESPADFNHFLGSCTLTERILMLQALKDLPSLKDEYFGKLKGLPALDKFTTDRDLATPSNPLKPSTFNEVSPETVIDALDKGIIRHKDLTTEKIRKALLWRAYNKSSYIFRGDARVDYHEIVKWVAKKSGVPSEQVNSLSTAMLENKITEKYFEKIWDNLSQEQRAELLKNMEKETGLNFDIATISGMGAAAALGAIQAAIMAYGVPVIMAETGYWLIYLLFGNHGVITTILAYLGYSAGGLAGIAATPIGWIITGPIGLTISAGLLAGGIYMMGSAEKETVSAFIMTVGLIKYRKYIEHSRD